MGRPVQIRSDPPLPLEVRDALELLIMTGNFPPLLQSGSSTLSKSISPAEVTVEFGEFDHFVFNDPKWPSETFRQARKVAKRLHPIDIYLPPEITERIKAIKSQLERQKLTKTGTCERFYELGIKPYTDGGLGFFDRFSRLLDDRDAVLTSSESKRKSMELTAADAFAGVLDSSNAFGGTSETAYKILTAYRALQAPCELKIIQTHNHVFVEHQGRALDPTGIGELGWRREITPAQLAALYYERSSAATPDPEVMVEAQSIASHIDPNRMGTGTFMAYANWVGGHYDVAVSNTTRAIQLHPDNIEPALFLFHLARSSPSPERQRTVAHNFMSMLPDHIASTVVLSGLCFDNGTCEEEVAWLKKTFPDMGLSEMLKAQMAFKDQSLDSAEMWLGLAKTKFPAVAIQEMKGTNHPLSMVLQLGAKISLAKQTSFAPAVAEQDITWSLNIAPLLPGSHATLAEIYRRQGRYDLAYQEMKREFVISTRLENLFAATGECALQAGDVKSALDFARQHVVEVPEESRGYALLAKIALTGHTSAAIELAHQHAKRAVELAMKEPSPLQALRLVELSRIALLLNNGLVLARGYAEQALTADPNSFAAKQNLIEVLLATGTVEARKEALARARDMTTVSEEPQVWSFAATVLARLGYLDDAEAYFRRALTTGFVQPETYAGLFEVLLSKDPATARQFSEEMRRRHENTPWFLGVDAYVAMLQGEQGRALDQAAKALKYNPNDYHALIASGLVYVQRKTPRERKKSLQEANRISEHLKKMYPFAPITHVLEARVNMRYAAWSAAQRAAEEAERLSPNDDGSITSLSVLETLVAVLEERKNFSRMRDVQTRIAGNRRRRSGNVPGKQHADFISSPRY
ncbi:MAG: hypothetical protein HY540_07910 [Deltaproteobacteria bacterium]|nr:hypothetical protein [Deltaproteobacteria bacterium]